MLGSISTWKREKNWFELHIEERRLYFFPNGNSDFSLLPTALEKVYVSNSFKSQPQMQNQNPRMDSISYHISLLSFNILPSVVTPPSYAQK